MRIYADVNRLPNAAPETTSTIIQVGLSPSVGTQTPINGKFVVDIPEGVTPPRITELSRLVDSVDPNYIVDDLYEGLRRAFPDYRNVVYNQLLTSNDVLGIDSTATFPYHPGPPARAWASRYQTGRGSGAPVGLSPCSVALLPENTTTAPPRPGLMVTKTIDISAATGGRGANNFIVYWKVYRMVVTDDVLNYGTGANTPTIKNLLEINQDEIEVFLSVNDGAGYTPVPRLSPVVTCEPGTRLRLAFVNHHPINKVYITAYAVLF